MMITLLAIYTEGNPASLTPQCGCLCHHSLVSSRSEREREKHLFAKGALCNFQTLILLYNRAAVIS